MRLRVVLEPSDEGGYTAYVPSLPGCISEGKTVDEALKNVQEAIELYLVDSDSHGHNRIVECDWQTLPEHLQDAIDQSLIDEVRSEEETAIDLDIVLATDE